MQGFVLGLNGYVQENYGTYRNTAEETKKQRKGYRAEK